MAVRVIKCRICNEYYENNEYLKINGDSLQCPHGHLIKRK